MALKQLFTNNAVTLLAAPITASDTSLTVMTGYGALFPNPGVDEFFLVTLENQAATAREIIKITGRTGDVFTFSLSDRGQEDTVPQAWGASSGNDTLVDHRVTAETLDRALADTGIAGIDVQDHGSPIATAATTLNFEGSVSVSGSGTTKTITITGGNDIHGSTTLTSIVVDPGWTIPVSTVAYSQYQRGFKFFVTLLMPANQKSCTFEVLGNIGGNISANAEVARWNQIGRVGDSFVGEVNITLNTSSKVLELVWTNGEANSVEVLCTRIQHLP